MFRISKRLLGKELSAWQKLGKNAKDLLVSNWLYSGGDRIVDIFANAYIWVASESLMLVVAYNLAHYLVLPIGFYLNGILLRRFGVKSLLGLGMLLMGVSPLLFVIVSDVKIVPVLSLGVATGLGLAFYWSNRNFLTLDATSDQERDYFYGMDLAVAIILGMAIPPIAGSAIALFRDEVGGVNSDVAYQGLMAVALIFFLLAVWVLRDNKFSQPLLGSFFVKNAQPIWKKTRLMLFLRSINQGMFFYFPIILILIYVGDEAQLGIVEGIGAFLAVVASYVGGRIVNSSRRFRLYLSGSLLLLSGIVLLIVFNNPLAVLLLVFLQRASMPLIDNAVAPIMNTALEKSQASAKETYAYICDQELYINAGRAIGAIIFLVTISYLGQEDAIRFLLVILLIAEILSLLSVKRASATL